MILIDAKWYYQGPASGRIVISNLVNNISIEERNKIILVLKRKDRDRAKNDSKLHGFKLIYIPSIFSLFDNIITLAITLLFRNDVKIVFCQNYVPLFGSFKKVAHIHDVLFLEFKNFYSVTERIYFWPLKFNSMLADGIITVSKTEKNRISKNYGIQNDKIKVIYHGVENIFKPSGVPFEKRKDVMFVGRLNVRKNIKVLLEMWIQNSMESKLYIVGDYDWKGDKYNPEELKKNNIIFLGSKSHNEVVNLMSNIKLFLFPSLAESFGLPIVEAMKSGVPVICFSNTCIPEIVGKDYPIIEGNNISKYFQHLNFLYKSKTEWENVSKLGIQNAEKYNWKESSITLVNYLKSLISMKDN